MGFWGSKIFQFGKQFVLFCVVHPHWHQLTHYHPYMEVIMEILCGGIMYCHLLLSFFISQHAKTQLIGRKIDGYAIPINSELMLMATKWPRFCTPLNPMGRRGYMGHLGAENVKKNNADWFEIVLKGKLIFNKTIRCTISD